MMNVAVTDKKSFRRMNMCQIIEFLLTTQSENNVIKEHFTSVWTSELICLDSGRDYLEIRLPFAKCSLKFEERGSNVAVKIKSDKKTRTRVVTIQNVRRNTAACIVMEKILRGTQLQEMVFNRSRGDISLHDLASISSISNLGKLHMYLERLTEAEARFLVTDFPHAEGKMSFNISEEPKWEFANVGSIATRNLRSYSRCFFLTVDVLLNSRISNITLRNAKFDHFEMQLYVFSWQCGSNSTLESFICRVDDDFDISIPVNCVRSITLQEAKTISGRFKLEDCVEFRCEVLDRINGENGVHITREDGKIGSFFKHKESNEYTAFLFFVWTAENPRRRTKSFRFRTNHATSN